MSELWVTNVYNQQGDGAPNFPNGATVTGVITATSFSGSGANLTGIDATALKDGSGNVKIQANSTGAVVTGILTTTGPVTIGGTLTYEDVTNVDAVGLITARDGIRVTGGDVQVGSAVTVDTSGINVTGDVPATSFSGSGANLTGIEAAPTIQLNATGAIAQDEACIVHTDGTAKKIQLDVSHQTPANGELRFSSSYEATYVAVAYNSVTKQIVTQHRRESNGYQYATAGKDDGNNWFTGPYGDTTSDTEKTVWGTNSYCLGAVADESTGKFIFTMRNSGNSDLRAQIYQVESDGTFHTSVQNASIYAGSIDGVDSCYVANAQKSVIYYRKSSNTKCYARTITTSSSDFGYTLGTEVVIADFGTGGNTTVGYIDNTNKVVFTYKKNTDNYSYAKVGTVESNGSITLGSEVSIFTTNGESESMQVVYSPVDEKAVFIMGASGSSLTMRIGSVTGSGTGATISSLGTAGTDAMFDNGAFYAAYDETAQRVAILWNDGANSNNASVVTMNISGTSFTFGTKGVNLSFGPLPIRSTSVGKSCGWIYSGTSKNMLFVSDQAQWSYKAAIRGVITATDSTNLTTENFLGFSKAAYTNGQTATIKAVGNTTTKSGLTPGQKYYVQKDGSVGVNPDTPSVEAGLAVSATSLLIK